MNSDLVLRLKNAGFPQKEGDWYTSDGQWIPEEERRYIPTLSELIEACGEFNELVNLGDKWIAYGGGKDTVRNVEQWHAFGEGSTPEEAVANLWLALNKHE